MIFRCLIPCVFLLLSGIAQAITDKPNILLIVGDDIGFGDLGISGSVTRTPNLDTLAQQGTFFTSFHVSPVCSVSRSMMLTGNDPIEIGLGAFDYAIYPPAGGKPGYEAYLTHTTATIAEILRDAGYRTYTLGKWHPRGPGHGGEGPEEWGFESQKKLGIIPQDAPYPERKAMATYSAMMESQDYHIGLLLNYLRETGELDNTLIIYTPDNGPEGSDFRGKLSSTAFTQWVRSTFSQDIDDIGRGNSMTFLGTDWAGAVNGSLQWWKWFIGEGGIRVPLIVVPPKNTAFTRSGEMSNAYAYAKELPMTILDYAGVDHPQTDFKGRKLTPPSGVSLCPYLAGEESSPRTEEEWVVFELFNNK
jgi:arylsulfatase A-like enzyme